MTYPFHVSMNDADASVSLGERRESVGNSSKSAQVVEGVQSVGKDADLALGSMWAAFKNATSPPTAPPPTPMTTKTASSQADACYNRGYEGYHRGVWRGRLFNLRGSYRFGCSQNPICRRA